MKLWRDLSKVTKARYKRQGTTPQAYNAWQKKTPKQRAKILAKAPPDVKSGPAAISHAGRTRRAIRAAASSGITPSRRDALADRVTRWFPAKADRERVRQHIGMMTAAEFTEAESASMMDWRSRATRMFARRYIPQTDETISLYFYH